jgi:hypothetical protein
MPSGKNPPIAAPSRNSSPAMSIDEKPLANELIRAVELLSETFHERSIRYALIGGLAAMLRGRPRFTQDVDVLLEVPQLALPPLVEELSERGFSLNVTEVVSEFVRQHLTTFRFGTTRIDWLKPVLPLYGEVLTSASELNWTEGHKLRVASPEGLILTKMVAFRDRDREDIETLLAANHDQIDFDLIRRHWQPYADSEPARTAWLEDAMARVK